MDLKHLRVNFICHFSCFNAISIPMSWGESLHELWCHLVKKKDVEFIVLPNLWRKTSRWKNVLICELVCFFVPKSVNYESILWIFALISCHLGSPINQCANNLCRVIYSKPLIIILKQNQYLPIICLMKWWIWVGFNWNGFHSGAFS